MPKPAERYNRLVIQRSAKRPAWPYPHIVRLSADMSRNQWVKRIRGKLYSFGVLKYPDRALTRYQREGPALHAGRLPASRAPAPGSLTVGELVGRWLDNRAGAVESGRLAECTYRNYHHTASRLLAGLGVRRLVVNLGPGDFERLISDCEYGPTRRACFVTWARQVFGWAADQQLIPAVPVYGKAFRAGSAKERRELRYRAGANMFSAAQVRALVAEATPLMRAAVLLGINGGMGNTDIAGLECSTVTLEGQDTAALAAAMDGSGYAAGIGPAADTATGGHIRYLRRKNAVERFIPLWPETARALAAVYPGVSAGVADGLWLTDKAGRALIRGRTDGVASRFKRLTAKCGQAKKRLGFYTLRHTFRTVADAAGDQHATARIMGHVIPGMAGVYVEAITAERCAAVAEHVRAWYQAG